VRLFKLEGLAFRLLFKVPPVEGPLKFLFFGKNHRLSMDTMSRVVRGFGNAPTGEITFGEIQVMFSKVTEHKRV